MMSLVKQLERVIVDIEQAAREIYYAKSFLEKDHKAHANLNVALEALGVNSPRQVGLSDRVLSKNI